MEKFSSALLLMTIFCPTDDCTDAFQPHT